MHQCGPKISQLTALVQAPHKKKLGAVGEKGGALSFRAVDDSVQLSAVILSALARCARSG